MLPATNPSERGAVNNPAQTQHEMACHPAHTEQGSSVISPNGHFVGEEGGSQVQDCSSDQPDSTTGEQSTSIHLDISSFIDQEHLEPAIHSASASASTSQPTQAKNSYWASSIYYVSPDPSSLPDVSQLNFDSFQ